MTKYTKWIRRLFKVYVAFAIVVSFVGAKQYVDGNTTLQGLIFGLAYTFAISMIIYIVYKRNTKTEEVKK